MFPFYKEKNQSLGNITILCKIPEGKVKSHFQGWCLSVFYM